MWYAATAARLLLGAAFIFSAGVYFATAFRGDFGDAMSGDSGQFVRLTHHSGYLAAVKVVELVGGLLLVSGYFVPVGLSLLGPVIVNIALFAVCLSREPVPLTAAAVVVALEAFLIVAYRRHFAAVFDPGARPG